MREERGWKKDSDWLAGWISRNNERKWRGMKIGMH